MYMKATALHKRRKHLIEATMHQEELFVCMKAVEAARDYAQVST